MRNWVFGIGLFQGGTNLFLNSILLGTLYCGGHLLSTGQLSPGNLMAFLMATQTIQKSLSQLSLLFGTYVKGMSAGARVFEVCIRLYKHYNNYCKVVIHFRLLEI